MKKYQYIVTVSSGPNQGYDHIGNKGICTTYNTADGLITFVNEETGLVQSFNPKHIVKMVIIPIIEKPAK